MTRFFWTNCSDCACPPFGKDCASNRPTPSMLTCPLKSAWRSWSIRNVSGDTTTTFARACLRPHSPCRPAPEDLDLSPTRGLDRRLMLELDQCTWIGNHLNILVLGPTGGGKKFRGVFVGYSRDPTGLFCALLPHLPLAACPCSSASGRFLPQLAPLPGAHGSAHPG